MTGEEMSTMREQQPPPPPPPAAQPGHAPAPAAPAASGGAGKMILAVVVVIIIVIAAIAVVFLVPGETGPGQVNQSKATPEELLDAFFIRLQNDDVSGALNLTAISLMSAGIYEDYFDDFSSIDAFDYSTANISVKKKADMSAADLDETEEMLDSFLAEFDITGEVEDFYIIEADLTIGEDGKDPDDIEWYDIGFKINGKWYLMGYMWVIGIVEDGGSAVTPVGAWSSSEATSPTEGKITFGQFTHDVPPLDIRIIVYENGTLLTSLSFTSNTASAPAALSETPSVSLIAEYTDFNPQGGTINAGDYISFFGLNPGSTYTFTVFHVPSDSEIIMTGDDGRIITP